MPVRVIDLESRLIRLAPALLSSEDLAADELRGLRVWIARSSCLDRFGTEMKSKLPSFHSVKSYRQHVAVAVDEARDASAAREIDRVRGAIEIQHLLRNRE